MKLQSDHVFVKGSLKVCTQNCFRHNSGNLHVHLGANFQRFTNELCSFSHQDKFLFHFINDRVDRLDNSRGNGGMELLK